MSEIIKQYSGAILVTVAAVLLFAILFAAWPVKEEDGSTRLGSVMENIGQEMEKSIDKEHEDWSSHVDGTVFDAHAARNKPTAKTKKHAVELTPIALSDLFLLVDNDGREWRSSDKKWVGSDQQSGAVDILSVVNSSGVDIAPSVWDRTTQVFTFPEPDTLQVTIRVMDYDNVEATYTIPVAVDMQYPGP